MYELGDKIELPNDITATIMGWRRFLGGNTEWCVQWWDGVTMVEEWWNTKQLQMFELDARGDGYIGTDDDEKTKEH